MKLTEVFQNPQLKNPTTQAMGNTATGGKVASVGKQIQALAPGQTLQGEVVSREGNQVQIKVADDFVLEAKVDANVHLEVGKTLTFEVRNNGQTLQLSPLFTNTATQANALKALEMASLPVNQDTVAMTGLMMKAGLSIDRSSLQQVFREINTFSNANIADVVDLHQLGLPVNEENLTQVASYKNLTHQLVDGMHTIQNSLGETMGNMVAEGNTEGAAKVFYDVLDLVQGLTGEEPEMNGETTLHDMQGNAGREGIAENISLKDGSASLGKNIITEGFVLPDAADTLMESLKPDGGNALQNGQVNGQIITNQAGNILKSPLKQLQEVLTMASGQMSAEEMPLNQSPSLVNTLVSLGQNEEYGDLINQLSKALEKGDITGQAKALQELLACGLQNGDKNFLEKLIYHKDARNILSEGISKLWTITPKDVADSGKVDELYNRLNRQLKDLGNILEQNHQQSSVAFKAVNNMSRNLDFLQQINQAYTYVQLPLKFQNGEAHGDLYVYTNKRNLSARDGEISALLHLDMEYLGPVDVYVAMHAEKVNTRFYVQDDEMLGFLEAHMDILTQRLQKRGYTCDFAMQVRDSEEAKESGLKGLMAKSGAVSIAQYAFDVRT